MHPIFVLLEMRQIGGLTNERRIAHPTDGESRRYRGETYLEGEFGEVGDGRLLASLRERSESVAVRTITVQNGKTPLSGA